MENDDSTRRRRLPPRYPACSHRRSSSLLPQLQYNPQTHFTTRGSVCLSGWSSGSSYLPMQSSSPLPPPMSGDGAGVQGGFGAGSSCYQIPSLSPASAIPMSGGGGVDGRGSSSTHHHTVFFLQSQPPSNSHIGLARMVAATCTPPQPSFLVNQAAAYGLPPRQPQSTTLSGSMQQYNMPSFVDQASSSLSPLPPLSSFVNQATSSSYGLPQRVPPQSTTIGSSMEEHGLAPLPPSLITQPTSANLDVSKSYVADYISLDDDDADAGGGDFISNDIISHLESLCGLNSSGNINEVVNVISVRKEPVSNSMDNFTSVPNNHNLESILKLPVPSPWQGGASSSRSRRSRYDVPLDLLVVDFADGTFTEDERKKIMADKRLAALVLTDPKYVRRTLDNRRASERSRDRRRMYLSNLENKVEQLEKETGSLSTQVQSLQSRADELTTENNELKTRLQGLEQESQLRCAISDILSAEVQQLKLDAGKIINDSYVSNGFSQEMMSSQIIQPGQLEIQDLPSVLQQAQAQEPSWTIRPL